MSLRQLVYPNDLGQLSITSPTIEVRSPGLSFPCTGKDLYAWSAELEAKICETLDSFGPLRVDSLPGYDSLFSLALIRPETLRIDNKPIASQTLLMMDDIHKLTSTQRTRLFQEIIEFRSPIGVWIAERFEALTTSEMLASGASEGRDYGTPIIIEPYWRRHYQNFEKYAMKIADRRVQSSTVIELNDFRPCIPVSLDGPTWSKGFQIATDTIKDRLKPIAQQSEKYDEWFKITEQKVSSPQATARTWQTLEILIARNVNRKQLSLLDVAIPASELDAQWDSDVAHAAELFLCKEFDFPYYYGPERLARLASLNIQQFLGLSEDIFEGLLSANLLDAALILPPEEQHRLMKDTAKSLWENIPRSIKHGRDVRNLIDGIGRFAQWYTYRPTAPNDPGVAGSAIRMSERRCR
jgi:hypothetical protein